MKNLLIIGITLFVWGCSSTAENTQNSNLPSANINSPAGPNASLPHLIKGGDNNLYLSWVEKGDSSQVMFMYSMLNESGWSAPELISKGNDWFVNWADYPMIAVDKDGNKIAHYLAKSSNGTYSYDVNVVIKPSTEEEWSPAIIPHKDGTPTEHGFVTMLPNNDGTFLLAWLDGRNTGGGGHGEGGHGGGGAMTIRAATLDMQGELTNEVELDSRVCDCCQTGGTITSSGPVITYRDRSDEEVRDMSYVSRVNNQWSEPTSIANDNWKIPGCPVNGPRITSIGNTIASAWFTAANGEAKVKASFNIGKGFTDPIIIDETSPIGRVDVVLLDENTAIVSWLAGGESPSIMYRTVSLNGTLGDPVVVAETSESRGSGFPQMEVFNGFVYFAWTKGDGQTSTIQMTRFPIQ